jgi:hypothetical protein
VELLHCPAHAAGIKMTHRLVVTTAAADPDGVTITVLQHMLSVESGSRRRLHRVVGAGRRPVAAAVRREGAWHRVGDRLASRPAHAAIIEGRQVEVML